MVWRSSQIGLVATLCVLAGVAHGSGVEVLSASYGEGIWVLPEEPLGFELSRLPDPGEGRLAVFVGHRDVSAFLEFEGSSVLHVPIFDDHDTEARQVAIYLVTRDGRWIEIDRRPLRIGRPPALDAYGDAGLEQARIDPYLDVAIVGQVVEHSNDDFGDPERHRFAKGTVQAGWTSQHASERLEVTSNANFLGATFKEEALRFAERGRTAPRFDLSDYRVDVRSDRASVHVGHLSFGSARHLIDGFTSRGVQANVLLHDRVDLSAVALSSTRIVGYDNLSGLSRPKDRLAASTLGLQLLQNDYASARLEGTWLSGSRESDDDFNVGQITDVEKNQGFAARFLGDFFGRLRLDASWTWSRFDNPADSEQSLGALSFESETESDDALFADLAVDLVRDLELGEGRFANLTLLASYERIEPLFQTLTAFTFADTETMQLGFVADVGGLVVTAQRTLFENNLDDLDQVLKTRSHDTLLTAELPLGVLFGRPESPIAWLPTAAYSYDRFHEYGSNFPDAGSGFAPGDIPDQVIERHDANLAFGYGLATVSYLYNRSALDNRQLGRERDDFLEQRHGLEVAFHLDWADGLDVSFGAGRLTQWSRAEGLTRRTLDASVLFDLRFLGGFSLSGSYFYVRETDSEDFFRSKTGSMDGQLSYDFALPLPGRRTMPGRVYVRASRNSTRFEDNQFDFRQRPRQWTLLVGTSISLF